MVIPMIIFRNRNAVISGIRITSISISESDRESTLQRYNDGVTTLCQQDEGVLIGRSGGRRIMDRAGGVPTAFFLHLSGMMQAQRLPHYFPNEGATG